MHRRNLSQKKGKRGGKSHTNSLAVGKINTVIYISIIFFLLLRPTSRLYRNNLIVFCIKQNKTKQTGGQASDDETATHGSTEHDQPELRGSRSSELGAAHPDDGAAEQAQRTAWDHMPYVRNNNECPSSNCHGRCCYLPYFWRNCVELWQLQHANGRPLVAPVLLGSSYVQGGRGQDKQRHAYICIPCFVSSVYVIWFNV